MKRTNLSIIEDTHQRCELSKHDIHSIKNGSKLLVKDQNCEYVGMKAGFPESEELGEFIRIQDLRPSNERAEQKESWQEMGTFGNYHSDWQWDSAEDN